MPDLGGGSVLGNYFPIVGKITTIGTRALGRLIPRRFILASRVVGLRPEQVGAPRAARSPASRSPPGPR